MTRAWLIAVLLQAGIATAQQSPAEIRPEQVAQYRVKLEAGCVTDAKAGGLSQQTAQAMCSCWGKSLGQSVTEPEWQAATFHALKRDEAAESQVLVAHVRTAARLCASVGR
jgi:NAD-dependent oxidoreductase involved in siderophore biosynthesis